MLPMVFIIYIIYCLIMVQLYSYILSISNNQSISRETFLNFARAALLEMEEGSDGCSVKGKGDNTDEIESSSFFLCVIGFKISK